MKYLLMASMIFLFGCKKSDTPQQIVTQSESGTFTFSFNGTSIDGYTKTCEFNNGVFIIGGNSNLDNSISPKYIFEVSLNMPAIKVGQYTTANITYESMYAPSSYEYYYANEMILNIDSFNTSTKFIHCSFNGTMYSENDNKIYNVTNGLIYGTIQ